ncbi:MAG: hypothetical protein CMP10_16555 [Zetaproteobacteria bacterium]|nr:hypothetical protein [Pseudobdellovibrionaceae bacterium]
MQLWISVSLGLCFTSLTAYGWGERGHDLITRVAAHILEKKGPDVAPLSRIINQKQFMLGHLSNTPDIVWRSAEKPVTSSNSPTHYIDLEFVLQPKQIMNPTAWPKNINELEKAIATQCSTKNKDFACAPGKTLSKQMKKTGHAPWRVEQLLNAMSANLKNLGHKNPDPNTVKKNVDDALLYAGLASHFIGDLANPHHTSKNYDGWDTGNGGLHSYFETDIVNTYPMGFDKEVLEWALANKPYRKLQQQFNLNSKSSRHKVAFALAANSYSYLGQLHSIDDKHAIIKRSSNEHGLKIKAKRASPDKVKASFKDFTKSRLALSADTLANLWLEAWIRAGKPKLNGYFSYYYPVKPDYVWPNYLNDGSNKKSTSL